MPESNHDLVDFIRDATLQMSSDYERIRKRASEDPGTAGDQGEENWAELLRNWLPPSYQVVTKGRILSDGGAAGPQVDVLVLSPTYPKALISNKHYLSGGVVAAFECKITLKAAHVESFVKNAVAISRLVQRRTGSPFKELNSPIIYGLLAHAHQWKSPTSTPFQNIEKRLIDADAEYVKHPMEMPDLLCVANLGTWAKGTMAWVGPGINPWSEEMAEIYGAEGSATTAYSGSTKDNSGSWATDQPDSFVPIGSMITWLLRRLAVDDKSLRQLAGYFTRTGLLGRGSGVQRMWPAEIYSSEVRNGIKQGRLVNGSLWDEWNFAH